MTRLTHWTRVRTGCVKVGVSGCFALAACSSASDTPTGPGATPPAVTLTANKTRLTGLGDIALAAEVTGTNATYVKKVEFYERVIGADPTPRKLGADSVAPYEFTRPILSVVDDGSREFTAKAYEASGEVVTSNALMVVVNLAADTTTLRATVSASHTRITTPGRINFTVAANKAVSRVEVYSGTNKVAEVASPAAPFTVGVAVTATDNGTQAYVAKAYDLTGNVAESAPISVVVDIRWGFVHTIEGIHSHDVTLIATDATNALYIAGTTETFDVFLVKHDADGNRLWIRNFGGGNAEYAKSVGVDPSGRVFVTGDAFQAFPSLRSDCFIALYDSEGRPVWTQVVDIPGWEKAACVATTDPSGNFYIAGDVVDSAARTTDAFLIKYDKDGHALWTRQFGSAPGVWNDDALKSIALDPLGGVYVGGSTIGSFDGPPSRGPVDTFVLKFDADGNRLWSKQYGSPEVYTRGLQLAADPDGGVYFAGDVAPQGIYNSSIGLLMRLGPDGALRWERTLDAGGDVVAWGVAANQHSVYIVGHSNRGGPDHVITEPAQGGYDGFLGQFTRDGNLISLSLLGTPLSEFANAVVIGVNGDTYVAGSTDYDHPAAIFTPLLARYHDAP